MDVDLSGFVTLMRQVLSENGENGQNATREAASAEVFTNRLALVRGDVAADTAAAAALQRRRGTTHL